MESELDIERKYQNVGLGDLPSIVEEVFNFGQEHKIWLFDAEMGAGKTTFITALSSYLEVEDHVSSPTFSIVNEYSSKRIGTLYHFDFYRIEDEREALDIGIEDYFYSGKLCLLEWPQLIPSFIPDDYLLIQISVDKKNNSRELIISKHGKGSIS